MGGTQVSSKTTDRRVAMRIALQYEDAVSEAKSDFVEASARKHIDQTRLPLVLIISTQSLHG